MPWTERTQARTPSRLAMSGPCGNGNAYATSSTRDHAEPRSPEAEKRECCALLRRAPVAAQASSEPRVDAQQARELGER
jgi:hypothetical protein